VLDRGLLLLESGLLVVELGDLRTLCRLGLAHDPSGGGVALGNERIALLDSLAHVLLVELARQLQEVVGAAGVDRVLLWRGVGDRSRNRCGHRLDGSGDRGLSEAGQSLGELALLGRGLRLRCLGEGGGLRGIALELADAGFTGDEALAQLLIFLVETAKLNDDLVQEVVDLVLDLPLTELGRLESLVDYIFRRKCHGCHLKKLIWYSANNSQLTLAN
jgi:hypothetical protein